LHVTAHAGEWDSGKNVWHAIEELGAERIGHGIRVLESPEAVELACKLGTTFEVCVTSNYQSGAVADLKTHPLLGMLEHGLNATINTDDPSISQITLSGEYRLACETLGLSLETLRGRVHAAANAAFLADGERQALAKRIDDGFGDLITG
jgi:adenosine deaminase